MLVFPLFYIKFSTNKKQIIMKLELKHLAPYLPYDVKVQFELKYHSDYIPNETKDYEYKGICTLYQSDFEWISEFKIYKPILRPLSDLTKDIEVNGEKFVPKDKLFHSDKTWIQFKKSINKNAIHCESYYIIEKLLEWHFDVFGLIPQGLAIDVNTLDL